MTLADQPQPDFYEVDPGIFNDLVGLAFGGPSSEQIAWHTRNRYRHLKRRQIRRRLRQLHGPIAMINRGHNHYRLRVGILPSDMRNRGFWQRLNQRAKVQVAQERIHWVNIPAAGWTVGWQTIEATGQQFLIAPVIKQINDSIKPGDPDELLLLQDVVLTAFGLEPLYLPA